MIISEFIALLGAKRVLRGAALAEQYHHIWHMDKPLRAKAYLMPESTEEVSEIMKICHRAGQPVVVFGGRTNLVGGTETQGEEVIISLERMNKVEEVDAQSRTMTVEAGVILEEIQNRAKAEDLLFPLNFGAKGSAQIGGIISSNAGGLRVFRYGMTRNLILGTEAVLADGTIISSLKKIIKDNSGYDLKQLFIGSEGTLGIVTKAVLKLAEAPKSRNSAFVALQSYTQVVDFLKFADSSLAGTLSGFELIWGETYAAMTAPNAAPAPPLPKGATFYVLMESLGAEQEKDRARLQAVLENAIEKEIISDAVLAFTEADLVWFWKIREDVHVLKSQCTVDQHFDISLPISLIGETVSKTAAEILALPQVEKVFIFGHVADGNIHFIVGKEHNNPDLTEAVNRCVYEPLRAIGGSVSAEHGIGLHKKKFLSLSRDEAEIGLMLTLKKALDPKGILNPGRIVPRS